MSCFQAYTQTEVKHNLLTEGNIHYAKGTVDELELDQLVSLIMPRLHTAGH